jgi:hypothetical protein
LTATILTDPNSKHSCPHINDHNHQRILTALKTPPDGIAADNNAKNSLHNMNT